MEEANIQEETIVIKGYKEPFTYSLSNSLADIKTAINQRMGAAIANLDSIDIKSAWRVNTILHKKVKVMMNKWDVNYSITIYDDDDDYLKLAIKHVALNWHIDKDVWLFCQGMIFGDDFFAMELLEERLRFQAILAKIERIHQERQKMQEDSDE